MILRPHDAPPIPDPYYTGVHAYADGYGEHENPHPYGSDDYDEWVLGWRDAERDAAAERRHSNSLRYPGAP